MYHGRSGNRKQFYSNAPKTFGTAQDIMVAQEIGNNYVMLPTH